MSLFVPRSHGNCTKNEAHFVYQRVFLLFPCSSERTDWVCVLLLSFSTRPSQMYFGAMCQPLKLFTFSASFNSKRPSRFNPEAASMF